MRVFIRPRAGKPTKKMQMRNKRTNKVVTVDVSAPNVRNAEKFTKLIDLKTGLPVYTHLAELNVHKRRWKR